jgi:DNA-directed RNA polymerase specialized sigma24 family protein
MADLFPPEVVRTVRAEAPRIAKRFGVDEDDLAHRVIEKFSDHRRACLLPSCRTCRGQEELRFVRGALKNEGRDLIQERKTQEDRETRGARSEILLGSDPARLVEDDETEQLLKFTSAELAKLRARDRGWYEAFLLSALGRSHREIASILSLSEANSQQHVSRARRFLRDLRRRRLLAMAAVGAGVLAVAAVLTGVLRGKTTELPATPLQAAPLTGSPLSAKALPGNGLRSAQELVSIPLTGG